ncbi:MAG: histidinol-phosphate transaminase [Thermoleophilaceae bacterium]|nr:histidinol-phosphate transaminase [Thermoleophilaceae bacterium]
MPIRINETIAAIPVYPQASTYDFGGPLVKMSSNESPHAPHPAVAEAITAAGRNVNRYPDPSGSAFRAKLAETYDMAAEQIVLGNGSCEILLAGAQVLLEPGAELVYAWPSFSMYPHLAAMTGATAVEVPLTADHRHDLDAMVDAITPNTRMVLVCNPNNPTGTFVDHDAINTFVSEVPDDVCIVIDEAYIEFVEGVGRDDLLPLVIEHDNVVITRTFAKIYGLAGLRVGYGFAPLAFKQAIDLVRQPFSVNLVAQAAAAEALNHPDDVTERVMSTLAERQWIETELRDAGFATAETQTNFSWIDLGGLDEDTVVNGLAKAGIIVRAGRALGAEGFIRASYCDHDENARFIAAMRGFTQQ